MKQKALYFGKRFIKSELITGSFYLFIGSMIGNVLAFLLNVFLARNLTAIDYGIYASLLSLITLVGIPAQSLTPVIVRFAADYIAKDKMEEAAKLYRKTFKMGILMFIGIFLTFIVLSVPIQNFFKLDNVNYVILSGLVVSSVYLGIVNTSFLQSLLKFPFMSITLVAGGITRLIFGVLLVYLGYRAYGALWASFFSFLIPLSLGFIPLRFLQKIKDKKNSVKIPTKEIVSYAFPTAVAILSLTSLISIDVILVKHFFTAESAGLYGGLSLMGKVIFYFTGIIPLVMFPLLIKRHAKGQVFNNLFYVALALVILPSSAITAFYFMFPEFSVNLFLGKSYLEIIPYLGFFGIFISIFSILNICVNFFLSLKKTKIAFVVLLGAISQIVLINFYHSSFFQIVGVSIAVSTAILVILLAYYVKLFGNFGKIKEAIAVANNPKN
jgi:O-antigen/teichoic acid export membrane protein